MFLAAKYLQIYTIIWNKWAKWPLTGKKGNWNFGFAFRLLNFKQSKMEKTKKQTPVKLYIKPVHIYMLPLSLGSFQNTIETLTDMQNIFYLVVLFRDHSTLLSKNNLYFTWKLSTNLQQYFTVFNRTSFDFIIRLLHVLWFCIYFFLFFNW